VSGARVITGDCSTVLDGLAPDSIGAVVTDPPYGLGKPPRPESVLRAWLDDKPIALSGGGFMGAQWDSFVPPPGLWRKVLRVLKPGAHAAVFASPRTMDWTMLSLRIAGFEIRDTLMWIYGSGMPKSMDASKAIDKYLGKARPVVGVAADFARDGARRKTDGSHRRPHAPQGGHGFGDRWSAPVTAPGCEQSRQWAGWGTGLKPAFEPIILARKPLDGPVSRNLLTHGVGAVNIDACRVPVAEDGGRPLREITPKAQANGSVYVGRQRPGSGFDGGSRAAGSTTIGRWPANVLHDGSDEVLDLFPNAPGQQGALTGAEPSCKMGRANCYGMMDRRHAARPRKDSGSAARFFYCAKASRAERTENGAVDNRHPTVKPVELMRWLVRLIAPPGETVLDPFAGSGSTGKACSLESLDFIGIELDEKWARVARARICAGAGARRR